MSARYPEWYELPAERWQEMTSYKVNLWDRDLKTVVPKKIQTWRDAQRQRLYDAEGNAKFYFRLKQERLADAGQQAKKIQEFNSSEEIEAYVTMVLTSPWVVKRFGTQKMPRISVDLEKSASCCVGRGRITLPPTWSWNALVILHEISHWIHKTGYGTAHGRFFARTFLEITGQFIGPEFRTCLKEAYKKFCVKSSPFPAYSEETLRKKRELGHRLAERYALC